MSLKALILIELRSKYPAFVHKGVLGRKAVLEWNFENENMGRRCRELENDGLIEKHLNEHGEVEYRAIPIDEVEASPQKQVIDRMYNQILENRALANFPSPFKEEKKETNQRLL